MSTQLRRVLKTLDANQDAALERLFELIRIPSVSTDPAYKAHCQAAAQWLCDQLNGIGFNARVVPTTGHPMVVAHDAPEPRTARPHVLFYGHYDVQPPEPLELWKTPPFEPVVKDGKLFARGAVDDKGQVYMHLKAIEAHMKVNGRLPVNLKVVIEGEEEAGSENLEKFLRSRRKE